MKSEFLCGFSLRLRAVAGYRLSLRLCASVVVVFVLAFLGALVVPQFSAARSAT
jgi:hypothetical protein